MVTANIDEIFPPRVLPVDVIRQVGEVESYRKLARLNANGTFTARPVPDASALSKELESFGFQGDDVHPLHIVATFRYPNGEYPSTISVNYAMALASIHEERFDGQVFLCIDGNETNWECLHDGAAASTNSSTTATNTDTSIDTGIPMTLTYVDIDREDDTPLVAEYPAGVLRTTYRGRTVWAGNIPPHIAEEMAEYERWRRYSLMLSKTSFELSRLYASDFRSRFSFLTVGRENDESFTSEQLSQLVQSIGCGAVESDFILDIEKPEEHALNRVEQFLRHNVVFENIDDAIGNLDMKEPDYDALAAASAIWKNIVFGKDNNPIPRSSEELLKLDLESLADEYGIQSYIEAYRAGVPVDDLLV